MNNKTGQEKRLYPRKAMHTQVIFEDEFGQGLFYVYSRDISLGGLFLESAIPLRLGTLLLLSFNLPEISEPIRVTGEAIRVSYPEPGMGIRFIDLPNKESLLLEKYIES
ncbi:MAG: PilZ domain-containing protein [Pseudomonadota bacterium]